MSSPTREALVSLMTRKLAGEKAKALAGEVGLTAQGLVAAWKKEGVREITCHNCGEVVVEHRAGACKLCCDEQDAGCPSEPPAVTAADEPAPAVAAEPAVEAQPEPRVEVKADEQPVEGSDHWLLAAPSVARKWLKVERDGEKLWVTERQLAGLKLAGQVKLPGDIQKQLVKKGWALIDGSLTDAGRSMLAAFTAA